MHNEQGKCFTNGKYFEENRFFLRTMKILKFLKFSYILISDFNCYNYVNTAH